MNSLLATTLSLLLLAPTMLPEIENAQGSVKWSTFRGAWFEVKYPTAFSVHPSLSSSPAQGYDSVFFRSSDGSVEFYIFSPQWNGEPRDAALKIWIDT